MTTREELDKKLDELEFFRHEVEELISIRISESDNSMEKAHWNVRRDQFNNIMDKAIDVEIASAQLLPAVEVQQPGIMPEGLEGLIG